MLETSLTSLECVQLMATPVYDELVAIFQKNFHEIDWLNKV